MFTIKNNFMKRIILLVVIALAFTLPSSAQETDMTLIPYRSGEKWGFADANKNIVVQPKYDAIEWFSYGYAAAKVGAKWGYINKAGKMVIPAKYTVAKPFVKGFLPNKNDDGGDTLLFAGASIREDGYEICITTKGTVLGQCPAKNEEEENAEPIEQIAKKKVYSLPNGDGLFDEIVADYMADGETYYIARNAGLYGVFNTKFVHMLPFAYNSISASNIAGKELLIAEKGGTFGLYDAWGKEIMPMDFSSLQVVEGLMGKTYVIAEQEGRAFVKDLDGNNVTNRGFNKVAYDKNGGFVLTGDNNLKGFYFLDNTYLSPKYTDVQLLSGGQYLKVRTFAGDVGYINTKGDEFFVQ